MWIALGASFESRTIKGFEFLNVRCLWIALGASIKIVIVVLVNGGVL